jgi:hypothetical protein
MDESGVFSLSILFHHGSLCACITCGMNNRLTGGCSSETSSYPIDVVVIINLFLIPLATVALDPGTCAQRRSLVSEWYRTVTNRRP